MVDPDKVAVVLYTTIAGWPAIEYLTDSMKHWGWPDPVMLEGDGVFRGHMGKMLTVKYKLPELRGQGYTHVLYTDCWDVVCSGPWEELLATSDLWETGALLSADAGNWSTVGLENDKFPDVGRFRYVNGGGWIGGVEFLVDRLFCNCEEEQHIDQWWLAKRYLLPEDGVRLDHQCRVFQCLSQCPNDVFKIEGGRVVNTETGTRPLLMHGAGGADLSWVPSVKPWQVTPRFSR